jgi:hypothetical protein
MLALSYSKFVDYSPHPFSSKICLNISLTAASTPLLIAGPTAAAGIRAARRAAAVDVAAIAPLRKPTRQQEKGAGYAIMNTNG